MLLEFTTDFKNIAKQESLRPNFGYRYFFDIQEAKIFSAKNYIRLREVLEPIVSKKVAKGELEEPEILVDIGNIEKRFNELINCERISKLETEKKVLQKGDIFFSKIRPWLGGIFLNIEHEKYIGSTNLLEYKILGENNPYFIYFLITANEFLDSLIKLASGTMHNWINPKDLLKIKIPNVPKFIQDRLVAEIEPIEKKIQEVKVTIKKPQEIIAKVFAKKFDFDLEKFEKDKAKMFFLADFNNISKNNLVRISPHFHHEKLKIIEKKLKEKNIWIPANSIFNLSSGVEIPGGRIFSDSRTNYFYLRPTEVNFWGINKDNVPNISASIFEKVRNYKIISNEFCASAVGTLGKIALINTDELGIEKGNLILSSNFTKLAPKRNINLLFYYYYFHSFIFQAQVDREYTITTIKALRTNKWNNIKVPNIPLSEQEKIVKEIRIELDEQEKIKWIIESERNKIDEIINYQLKKIK